MHDVTSSTGGMRPAVAAVTASRRVTYRDALREAIREALQRDPRVFLMGRLGETPRNTAEGLKE